MKDDKDIEGQPKKSSNRGLLIVILGGAVLIATGLAIGLGIGLRSSNSDCVIVQQTCNNPQTDNNTQTGNNPQNDNNTQTNNNPQTDNNTQTNNNPQTDNNTQTNNNPQTDNNTQTNNNPQTDNNTQTNNNPQIDNNTQTNNNPQTNNNTQTNNSTQYRSGYGRYRFAAVAADASLCSQIGTKLMGRYRGNAVDAAVATVICDGVMNAHDTGIGGGAFIVYYNRKKREVITINSRETAPGAANETMFVGNAKLSTLGGLAIGVPGELSGLWALHEKYGSLPWADLLQPTIDLCIKGAPLTQAMHDAIFVVMNDIVNNTEFDYLFDNEKNVLPVGSLIKRTRLAETLKTIAHEGISAFYNGSLTADVIADIRDANGIITVEDLQSYRSDIADPISFNLTSSGLTVHSMPPPGSGAIFEFILNILQGYNFSPNSVSTTEGAVLTYHRIVEAMKFAYAKRSQVGDVRFVNVSELVANMTSSEVGEQTRAMINDVYTQDTKYYGPSFQIVQDHGTAHFSIVDGEGSAVAVTSTVNTEFGSKVKGRRTGIIFNNQMDDFSTPNTTNYFGVPASPANFIVPGKRPMSSMCPSIIVDSHSGEVKLVVGGSGGTKITTSTALIAIKTLWLNTTLKTSVDDPRIHHQLFPAYIQAETGFPQEILDGLKRKGHDVVNVVKGSYIDAIHNNGMLDAVSDWRKGGAPDGF